MLEIYLPIAGLAVHPGVILALGAAGGVLSGLLGIGGGVLIAPGLMFLGIHPEVAVASHLNQVLATSVSGGLAYWHRQSLDHKLLRYLLSGCLLGAGIGLWVVFCLRANCQLQSLIQTGYAVLLPLIGGAILWDCWQRRREINLDEPVEPHGWKFWRSWPGQIMLPTAQLQTSLLAPFLIGLISGALMAVLGAGGGIIMVPAMIYGLGIPNRVAMGTSLVASACLTLLLTLGHSLLNGSVDLVLAGLLTLGGVVGAQLGVWLSFHTKEYYLRVLLAAILLISAIKLMTGKLCFLGNDPVKAIPHIDKSWIQSIFNLRLEQPWLYSMTAVLWAVIIGILADQLFRPRPKKG